MPRPPPPEIDHPYVFSVSQIDNFELCNRKWAFEKIDKIEKEDTAATLLGSEVHDQLEEYLAKGTPLDTDTQAGSIAMSGMRFLPMPMSPGMRIERWFAIQYGVAWYRGLKDIEIIRPGRRPQVKDHKTTKNFGWQKQAKDLIKDTQSCLYSYDSMEKTGFDEVDLEWIYYRTTGARKADNTSLIINRDQVEETMVRIDKTAQKMIHVLNTVTTGMDAEPNFGSCSAYGGCPHRDVRCKTTSSATLKSMIRQKMAESKDKTESFFEKLKNRQKEAIEPKKSGSGKKAGITSNEREEEPEIPGPPPPVKANGVWYQADFNEDTWEWVYPEEVKELKKKKSKVEKKKGKPVEVNDEPTDEEETEEEEEEPEETPLARRRRLKQEAAAAEEAASKKRGKAAKEEAEEPDDSELAALLLKLFKHLAKAVKNS